MSRVVSNFKKGDRVLWEEDYSIVGLPGTKAIFSGTFYVSNGRKADIDNVKLHIFESIEGQEDTFTIKNFAKVDINKLKALKDEVYRL